MPQFRLLSFFFWVYFSLSFFEFILAYLIFLSFLLFLFLVYFIFFFWVYIFFEFISFIWFVLISLLIPQLEPFFWYFILSFICYDSFLSLYLLFDFVDGIVIGYTRLFRYWFIVDGIVIGYTRLFRYWFSNASIRTFFLRFMMSCPDLQCCMTLVVDILLSVVRSYITYTV